MDPELIDSTSVVADNSVVVPDATSTQSAPSAGDASAEGVPTEAPAYTPNFKFKSYDKDYEIPENWRPLIKDAASEKEAREIFEKAYGVDQIKNDRQTVRAELAQVKSENETTTRGLAELSKFVQADDFDSFFESLNIPIEKVLRYAVKVAQRTPEQEASLASDRRAKAEIQQYDQGYGQLLQQNQQMAVQMRDFELTQHMSQPDIAQVVQAFNAGQENPEAFREFVIRIGQAHAASGKDIPVKEAVAEAARYLKGLMPQANGAAQVTALHANPNGVVAPNSKSTLPIIAGSGKTPVKTTVKNLDDLRRLSAERG